MKHHHRRRRRRRAAALGLLACAAVAAPAAADPPAANYPQAPWAHKIGDTPAGSPAASRASVVSAPRIGDTPADYPGMPGAPAQRESADAAPTGVHAPEAGGFDWPSAAIGAAGAGLLLVVSLGGVSVLSRRRTRIAR